MRELLCRIDSRELAEWQAFERIEGPIGQRRDDILVASQIAAVVNVNRSRQKPYPVSDFIPQWDQSKPSEEDMLERVRAMNAAMGGTED